MGLRYWGFVSGHCRMGLRCWGFLSLSWVKPHSELCLHCSPPTAWPGFILIDPGSGLEPDTQTTQLAQPRGAEGLEQTQGRQRVLSGCAVDSLHHKQPEPCAELCFPPLCAGRATPGLFFSSPILTPWQTIPL